MRTIKGKKVSVWQEGDTQVVGAFILGEQSANDVAESLRTEGYTVTLQPAGSKGLYSLLGEKPLDTPEEPVNDDHI